MAEAAVGAAAIKSRVADGLSIPEIMRRSGDRRKPVRSVIRGERTDFSRSRESALDFSEFGEHRGNSGIDGPLTGDINSEFA